MTAFRLFLHVLSASVWVGGMIVMAGTVPTSRHLGGNAGSTIATAFIRIMWPAVKGSPTAAAIGGTVSGMSRSTQASRSRAASLPRWRGSGRTPRASSTSLSAQASHIRS